MRNSIWMGVALGVVGVFAQAQTAIPTHRVQMRAAETVTAFDGVIQAVRQSTVSAQATGRIATLLVKAGDKVRSGQTLATIDDREVGIGIQRSQAQVSQAQAELRNARANWERARDLRNQGFVSQAALDSAATQHEAALAVREQALAGVRQSGVAQGYTRATAPYDGWVLQTHVEAGELATPGKPLLTLYAPQPLRVVVQVPASRALAVQKVTQLRVEVDEGNGHMRQIVPTSRSVVPAADPVSQTTEWRLELPPLQSAGLLPGGQVRVVLSQTMQSLSSTVWIPEVAVVRRGELTAVYVANGATFTLRAVRLGASRGVDGVEVLAGLHAGDVVALDPQRAGMRGRAP